MKSLSFDWNVIDIYFHKMAKIYFELGEDTTLKKAIISSLLKILVGHMMRFEKEKFKSITFQQIGYIR